MNAIDDSVLLGLIKRPAKDWSEEEKDLFAERVNELCAQGEVVILPTDHCFYCGTELTNNVLSINRLDERELGLIIPLCEDCNFGVSLTSNRQFCQN
ncbi:unnamed protein product [marine sediment metagenome]|uniref:Uncharacterized protein n=1 Tax=marine sediment metagenome TaxID=412755 RepID=X1J4R1_9ZZZZ